MAGAAAEAPPAKREHVDRVAEGRPFEMVVESDAVGELPARGETPPFTYEANESELHAVPVPVPPLGSAERVDSPSERRASSSIGHRWPRFPPPSRCGRASIGRMLDLRIASLIDRDLNDESFTWQGCRGGSCFIATAGVVVVVDANGDCPCGSRVGDTSDEREMVCASNAELRFACELALQGLFDVFGASLSAVAAG